MIPSDLSGPDTTIPPPPASAFLKPKTTTMKTITFYIAALLLLSFGSHAQSWTVLTSGQTEQFNSVYFTGKDTGHVMGEQGALMRTLDGGATWNKQTNPALSSMCGSVFMTSNGTGFVAGRDHAGTCQGGQQRILLLKTTNAGANWNCVNSGLAFNANWLRGNHYPTAMAGWSVGDMGTIVTTADGGTTWAYQNQSTSYMFRSVFFVSATTGWAVGSVNNTNSLILYTTNGGTTWTPQTAGTTQVLNAVYFVSATTGYIAGNGGVILKTTNAGTNWVAQTSGTTNNLNGICFTSPTVGIVVGATGKAMRTIDGGTNWVNMNSNTTNDLRSVHMPSSSTAYACGITGTIIKCVVTTGMENYDLSSSLSIFPNPSADGIFNISSEARIQRIEVCDLSGRVVMGAADENISRIDLSGYAKGVYMARAFTDRGVIVKKLIF